MPGTTGFTNVGHGSRSAGCGLLWLFRDWAVLDVPPLGYDVIAYLRRQCAAQPHSRTLHLLASKEGAFYPDGYFAARC